MNISEEMLNLLSLVTPGTQLREGIFNILDASRGALVVIGVNEEVKNMIDGGFTINCEYTPEHLFELAKMDGGIIIDENIEKIYYANVQLHPSREYPTSESGTRHRTAQRVALQTGKVVIAVSERRKSITVYKGDMKYKLKNIAVVAEQATQALKTLEKYRNVLDIELSKLTLLELEDLVTMDEVASIAQRFEMVYRIKRELKVYVTELGSEGRLINLQIKELLMELRDEKVNFIKDYYKSEKDDFDIEVINEELISLTDTELLELEKFSGILGQGKTHISLSNRVSPKGYRVLSKIKKLTKKDIEKLVQTYGNITDIQEATEGELLEIKGISKLKVKAIHREFKRIKNINQIGMEV